MLRANVISARWSGTVKTLAASMRVATRLPSSSPLHASCPLTRGGLLILHASVIQSRSTAATAALAGSALAAADATASLPAAPATTGRSRSPVLKGSPSLFAVFSERRPIVVGKRLNVDRPTE